MLSAGLPSCMFSTLYLGPGVCALFVPLLLVLGHSPFGLLHTCHLHSCKNSYFDYQRASDSIIFTVMDKEMQSVSLICTEVLIRAAHLCSIIQQTTAERDS